MKLERAHGASAIYTFFSLFDIFLFIYFFTRKIVVQRKEAKISKFKHLLLIKNLKHDDTF